MTEREKVIDKVTSIVADMQEEVDEWKDYSDSELRGGLTCDCDWWYKTLQTLKDALALLKAQEPRVMTLGEVMALEEGTGDVWIEDAPMPYTSHWIEAVTLVGKTDWQETDEVTFSNEITYHPTSYRLNTAQGWRCWTSRPTDEVRRATAWN